MPALELHKAKLHAGRRGRPAARHRLGGQLLDAAVPRGRATCSRSTPTGRPRTAPTSCRSRSTRSPTAQGHVYGMWHGTDCRVLYYRKDLVPVPPRDVGRAARRSRAASPRRRDRRLPLQRRPLGGGGVRPPARCSGPRAASWWTSGASRSSACRPIARSMVARPGVPAATRSSDGRLAALGARPQRLPAAHLRRHRRRRRHVPRRQLAGARPAQPALAGGVREVGRRAHPAGGGRAARRPAPAAGCG